MLSAPQDSELNLPMRLRFDQCSQMIFPPHVPTINGISPIPDTIEQNRREMNPFSQSSEVIRG
jgi:hypothetical protein